MPIPRPSTPSPNSIPGQQGNPYSQPEIVGNGAVYFPSMQPSVPPTPLAYGLNPPPWMPIANAAQNVVSQMQNWWNGQNNAPPPVAPAQPPAPVPAMPAGIAPPAAPPAAAPAGQPPATWPDGTPRSTPVVGQTMTNNSGLQYTWNGNDWRPSQADWSQYVSPGGPGNQSANNVASQPTTPAGSGGSGLFGTLQGAVGQIASSVPTFPFTRMPQSPNASMFPMADPRLRNGPAVPQMRGS